MAGPPVALPHDYFINTMTMDNSKEKNHPRFQHRIHCIIMVVGLVLLVFSGGCMDQGTVPPVPPRIDTLQPDTVAIGEVVKITGSDFGTHSTSHTVLFSNGVEAVTYLAWSDTEVRVVVPPAAQSGPVRIKKNTLESNTKFLIVQTIGGVLSVSPPAIGVQVSQVTTAFISGGQPPYVIATPPDGAIAQASISNVTLSVQGAGAGVTTVRVSDSSLPEPQFVNVGITVTQQASGVSFSQQVVPIFTANCTGCHGGTANLFLGSAQAYNSLVNVPAQTGACAGTPRVTPGNSGQSALYLRVSGTCSQRMPLGGSLTEPEITLIRQWIDQGALNN